MATRKRTTASYPAHIKDLWKFTIEGKLITGFPCASHGQAIHYRQRMYIYRKLAREEGLSEARMMDEWTLDVQEAGEGKALLTARISKLSAQMQQFHEQLLAQRSQAIVEALASPTLVRCGTHNTDYRLGLGCPLCLESVPAFNAPVGTTADSVQPLSPTLTPSSSSPTMGDAQAALDRAKDEARKIFERRSE